MNKTDADLISSAPNIKYLTMFYNFSETEREALLFIKKNKKILITDKRYSEEIKTKIKDINVYDMGVYNFINNYASDFFKKEKIKLLGFEANNLTYWEYINLKKSIKLKPKNFSNLRYIKNEDEIKK